MLDAPNFEKNTLAWTLPWDAGWVTALAFVGTSRKLVAGNEHGQLLLWELPEKTGEPAPLPTRRLDGHTNTVSRLVATPDSRWLMSASYDHSIRYWDMEATAAGSEMLVLQSKKAPNKEPVPSVTAQVAIQAAERTLTGSKDWIQALALSTDGNLLISGDDGAQVIVWDRQSGKELRRWPLRGWAYGMALTPAAKQLVVAERKPLIFDAGRMTAVKVWDVANGQMLQDYSAQFKGEHLSSAVYSPDGKWLAFGQGGETSGFGKIYILEAGTGKKARELPGHLNGVTDLAFTADSKYLLSSGRDTVVRVWQAEDGKKIGELGKPRGGQSKDWIHAIALSADQRWVAAADMAGQVVVYAIG